MGSAASGLRYFWCAMMGSAELTGCGDDEDDGAGAGPTLAGECCEVRQLTAVGDAALTATDGVSLAPETVADLPIAPPPALACRIATTMAVATSPRAGPEPPRFALNCAFLC
ncbi:MAG: hypothetical protein U1F43_16490 [Myxococcota bacterium]